MTPSNSAQISQPKTSENSEIELKARPHSRTLKATQEPALFRKSAPGRNYIFAQAHKYLDRNAKLTTMQTRKAQKLC